MFDFSCLSRRQRIIQRNRTERLSEMLDWKNLGIVRIFHYLNQQTIGASYCHIISLILQGVFPLPDSDSYGESTTDSDSMRKGSTGLILMLNYLIGINIGVKLGTGAIGIRIGIGRLEVQWKQSSTLL